MKQLEELNANYPGGLVNYITNARRLLEESKSGGRPQLLHIQAPLSHESYSALRMHAPQSLACRLAFKIAPWDPALHAVRERRPCLLEPLLWGPMLLKLNLVCYVRAQHAGHPCREKRL